MQDGTVYTCGRVMYQSASRFESLGGLGHLDFEDGNVVTPHALNPALFGGARIGHWHACSWLSTITGFYHGTSQSPWRWVCTQYHATRVDPAFTNLCSKVPHAVYAHATQRAACAYGIVPKRTTMCFKKTSASWAYLRWLRNLTYCCRYSDDTVFQNAHTLAWMVL